jgi:hypothetical protein
LTRRELAAVRKIIKKATWTHSTSERYKHTPHQYLVLFTPRGFTKREWTRLAKLVRRCGEPRTWHGQTYKYLVLDGFAYWVMWPIVNRAKASTVLLD